MRVVCLESVLFVSFLSIFHTVIGSYVITIPRKWTRGTRAQICMATSERSADDKLYLSVTTTETKHNRNDFWQTDPEVLPVRNEHFIPETVIVPVGEAALSCDEVAVPEGNHGYGKLRVFGRLGGVLLNVTRDIIINLKEPKTFVQTDKYLYKAGQKVKFRVLTIDGPFFKVSTKPYSEIFVQTPSGSRIAQWLNVSNTAGLLHKDLQLIDEPEEGVYSIKVRTAQTSETTVTNFKIEDYVLPRFEITVKPPKYLLADADILQFEICVMYTFGQPVKGNISVLFANNGWGRHRLEMTVKDQVFGCKNMEIPMRTFDINNRNYYVYSLSVTVKFEEEGTGTIMSKKADVAITRTVLSIKEANTFERYTKPELPYSNTLLVAFPDGSPASLEPMTVCSREACRNLTTDASGKLTYTLPPHLLGNNPTVKSINYPNRQLPNTRRTYMYESRFNTYLRKAFSPTNSSLLIRIDNSRLSCSGGENFNLELPVMYAAQNMSEAEVFVQVISRGQIQFWKSLRVKFIGSQLTVDEDSLLSPMKPPQSPFTVLGEFVLPLVLPSTISPKVDVLLWYSREDGEVVADAQELAVEKCLDHKVELSWPKNKVEQGTTLPLTLSAEPNSLCSIGIVDKSVDILSNSHESLTLEKVFQIAEEAEIGPYDNSQIDDVEYCSKKTPLIKELPDDESPPPVASPPLVPVVPRPVLLDDPPRVKRSSPVYFRRPFSTDVVDALKMFDKSGVHVITDLTTETRPCSEGYGYVLNEAVPMTMNMPMDGGFPMEPHGGLVFDDTPSFSAHSSPESTARTYFPETFLWELSAIESSGEQTQQLTLPDTITEWVGKAVCVHPSKGLGLSSTTSITTFTPFFIDLTLLPTVKMGEIMPIKISVFNYLETSLPVRITLDQSVEYDIIGINGTDAAADQSVAGMRSVCIPASEKRTVSIRVRPQAVGDVNVTVTATVDSEYPEECGPEVLINKIDRIIKPITVEFEGFPHEKTWTKYMCSQDLHENLDFFEEWRLEAPANIVDESARSWVTVVGDLLGPTLDNLGHLIRMPYGCGEQNMLNFAPNIYVMQYLEASLQITGAVTDKLVKYMKNGYQRELNYKHRDGSYSAFGESDDSGSTWLTAFVVKSFAQAQQYISVDTTELNMSRDWLKYHQLENGCFESVGKILHKGMKGGLSDGGRPRVLTAYVMAALLEAGEDPAGDVVSNAVFCLQSGNKEGAGIKGTGDPYELALSAYALNLARLPEADEFMSRLMSLAIDSSVGLYWKLPNSKGSSSDSSTPAVAVETAGYALMAMMAKDPSQYEQEAHRLVKWISAQRNSQGGFTSTQDTVVALQALAMYESNQSKEPLDLMVSITGENMAETFKVVESNKLLTQRAEVNTVPTNIILDMAGTGCTLVQGVVRYNVKDPEPSEAFSLNVSTSLDYGRNSCKKRKIRTCSSYLLNDNESNMAVIEVTLVSGYIPVKADLKQIVGYGTGIIKRYEVDGNKVLFYVDQFTARQTCVEFGVTEEIEVENAKPGTVKVYDYYEPEFFISEKYVLPNRVSCNSDELVPVIPLDDIMPMENFNDELLI